MKEDYKKEERIHILRKREGDLLQCSKCRKMLPKVFFWKDKLAKSGYISQCKICKKESKNN
jgi:hypothetical protein